MLDLNNLTTESDEIMIQHLSRFQQRSRMLQR